MAPLVPDMISPEFDFVIAFIMGIGFGFMLEQAGFSSTKKLVGLFYGYDFTVLKVFFTAGITAMVGVLLFSHLGWLNLEMVYVNPMFVWSALIGGLIMGAGFIMGGFCPGTSLCALAVGRIDAFFFVIGSVGGILMFTEFFPALETLYTSYNMGSPTMNAMLGMSAEVFGLVLTAVAIATFVGVSWIQDKVKGESGEIEPSLKRNYVLAGVVPFVIILLIAFTPSKKERLWQTVDSRFTEKEYDFKTIDAEKLAFELMYNAPKYNLIDVSQSDSILYSVPTSQTIKLRELDKPQYQHLIIQQYKTNIFLADNVETAIRAAILANEIGDKNPIFLTQTTTDFKTQLFDFKAPSKEANKAELDQYHFNMMASLQLRKMEERLKNLIEPPKKEVKKAKGGCS